MYWAAIFRSSAYTRGASSLKASDAAGANGTGKVRQTTKLSDSGNSYTGSGDFFYYDLNGAITLSGTFTIAAKRI